MKQALGDKYKDPREHKGVQGKASSGRFVSLKKASQIGIPKNMWTLGYLAYAYNVDKATFRRRWRAAKAGQQKSRKHIGTLWICYLSYSTVYNISLFSIASTSQISDTHITRWVKMVTTE